MSAMPITELGALPTISLDDVRDVAIQVLHRDRALVIVEVRRILAPSPPPLYLPPLFEFEIMPDSPLPDLPVKKQIGILREKHDGASFNRLQEFYLHRTRFRLVGEWKQRSEIE